MRITAVQSFSISSTGQRIGNDKHNVQCTTSHLADNRELSSYSYGRDLISRKNPSFTAGEISKAGQLLANQIPVEEKLAKEQLGMQKLTNKQTVNVVLPKKDYVEPARQKVVIEKNQEENWFQKLLDKLK